MEGTSNYFEIGWITSNAYGSFSDCGGTQIFGGFNTFGIDT